MRFLYTAVVAALLVTAGCQPAGRYGPPRGSRPGTIESKMAAPPRETKPSVYEPSADFVWMEPVAAEMEAPVPIEFVTASTDPDEWAKLKEFWNVGPAITRKPSADQVAAILGVSPFAVPPLAIHVTRVVKVKVPLGLEDPLAYTPSSNRPTLARWELGKRLFYDKEAFLQPANAEIKESCASCHDPAKGFTSGKVPMGLNSIDTPTLYNTVFNTYQFWNGRANALEEVVQRSLDDERDLQSAQPFFRHNWHGVIRRLRADPDYSHRFRQAFGTPPTQDAVGKAVATYVRTLLSGGSLQDKAEALSRKRNGNAAEERDYLEALKADSDFKPFQVSRDTKREEVAKELASGAALFRGKAGCIDCHGGGNYTDNGFHNLGIGDSGQPQSPGRETGRFAVMPAGLKDRRLIGAYKTPTLRSLPSTGPYFHNGLMFDKNDALFFVVHFHVKGGHLDANPFLSPAIRKIDLTETEIRAIVQFLKALDGEPLPEIITKAEPPPEKAPAPKKTLN